MKRHTLLEQYKKTKTQLACLASIAIAEDEHTAWSNIEALSKSLGFDYRSIGILSEEFGELQVELPNRSSAVKESALRYCAKGLQKSDPALQAVLAGEKAVLTRKAVINGSGQGTDNTRQLREFLDDEGIAEHGRIRVDVPGRMATGQIAVGAFGKTPLKGFEDAFHAHQDMLNLAAMLYSGRRYLGPSIPLERGLSAREAQVLALTSKGLIIGRRVSARYIRS